MKNWLLSLNGTITLSLFALLTFLGRGFMDWRYEYPLQDPTGVWDIPGALIYMALAGGWIWALTAAVQGSRRGRIALLILALVLDIGFALATYFIFCPPWTSCVGWPNLWLWNWANLVTGLLAVLAIAIQEYDSRANLSMVRS
jgi:hypothetical protein